MIKGFLVIVIFLLLSCPLYATGTDETYRKPIGEQIWGQKYNKLYHRSGFGRSYALVVGINNFESFRYLDTKNDPVKINNYLINEAGFDYVRLITGDEVTLDKIRSLMIDYFPSRLSTNDRFFFYWQGHGETSSENGRRFGYLPLSKSKPKQYSGMLSMHSLSQWDKRLKAKQTLYMVDACYSGSAAITTQSSLTEQTIEQIARPSRQILTAGLENEETIVLDDLGSSIFTTAVLDGLRGKADASSGRFDKDGIVSAKELELYIKNRVGYERRHYGWKKSITPVLRQLNDQAGDFFFFSDPASLPPSVTPLVPSLPSPVTPQSNGFEHQYNIDGCIVLRREIVKPIFINEGSCFTDQKNNYSSTIKQVTRDGILYTNFLGKEVSCYKNMQCSFGWENSPVFHFSQSFGDNEKAFILSSQ